MHGIACEQPTILHYSIYSLLKLKSYKKTPHASIICFTCWAYTKVYTVHKYILDEWQDIMDNYIFQEEKMVFRRHAALP
jgi:hypothetical protein